MIYGKCYLFNIITIHTNTLKIGKVCDHGKTLGNEEHCSEYRFHKRKCSWTSTDRLLGPWKDLVHTPYYGHEVHAIENPRFDEDEQDGEGQERISDIDNE